MPPSICCAIVSGLTYMPQSMAQITRWTRTDAVGGDFERQLPARGSFRMRTAQTRPLARPLGNGSPQAAFSAARFSTASARGIRRATPGDSSRGSCFAACASSSRKLSTTKTLCVAPTPRQNAVGDTRRLDGARSPRACSETCTESPPPDSTASGSMPSFETAAHSAP